MFVSTVITYCSGWLIQCLEQWKDEKKRKKLKKSALILSLVLNLAILFFFKYFNFTVDSINRILTCMHITPVDVSFDVILPVGISFYTFQALSYTIDVYRGDIYCEKNFLKYALFVSFFPQLVAGPIERSKNLLKQISVKHDFDIKRIQYGLTLMLFGFFQKMVISDNAAIIVDQVYDNYSQYGAVELVFASILFAFQIYCDFGGYSNIAIGAAKVMGFELMKNFDTPYLANTVSDFWRRWHISLTSWFRDYLYIPLGGNRKGKIRKYINILIVFLTSGLWHGSSWHFVIWGGLNGLYQIVGDLIRPIRDKICKFLKVNRNAFSHRFLKVMVTFGLVDISWIFFRAKGVREAVSIIKGIFTRVNLRGLIDGRLFHLGMETSRFNVLMVALIVLLFVEVLKYLKIDVTDKLCRQGIWFQYMIYLIMIFSVLIFGVYGPGFEESQFIYFQF